MASDVIRLRSVDTVKHGPSKCVRLIFDADGRPIVKYLLLSATTQAVAAGRGSLTTEANYLVMKACKEAMRDAVYPGDITALKLDEALLEGARCQLIDNARASAIGRASR